MSSLKVTWWRPAAVVIVLALSVLALSVSGAGTAHAGGDGSVSIVPADKDISVGGEGDVAVSITPSASGTSIWIVQFTYDPAVAQVKMSGGNPVCTVLDSPGGGIAMAAGCDVKDTNADTIPDTAVAFGGWVQNDNGTPKGFTTPQTVATFTFVATGAEGAHTNLTTSVTSFLGPNGETPTPTVNNGGIDIVASSGTNRVWGDGDCNGSVNPVDSLKILKTDAGQAPAQTVAGCPAYNANVTVNGITVPWGDFDCNGSVNPVDSLKILKTDAGQPPAQTVANCPAYGSTVSVSS